MIPFSLLILTSKRGKDFCTVLFFLCNHKTPYHSTWYNFFVNGALHTLSISIIGTEIYHLLEGSCLHLFFWDFDPEAHPGLKNPPDQSEILIRRNFRKHGFDADRNYIKKVKWFLEMIRHLQLLIQNDILLIRGKICLSDDWGRTIWWRFRDTLSVKNS